MCCPRVSGEERDVAVGIFDGSACRRLRLSRPAGCAVFPRGAVRGLLFGMSGRLDAGAHGGEQQRKNRLAISLFDGRHKRVGDARSGSLIEPPLDSHCQQKQADRDKRTGRQFVHHEVFPKAAGARTQALGRRWE